jgi:hypothetical protein
MASASSITWYADGDLCEAVIGEPLKWGRPDRESGQVPAWKRGRTVVSIDDGPPCWRVHLDPTERTDRWANPLLCGEPVEVELIAQPE